MFNFIKNKLQSIYTHFTAKIGAFFGRAVIDEAALKELEILLLASDVGVQTTQNLLQAVRNQGVTDGTQLYHALRTELIHVLQQVPQTQPGRVIVLVGINGSGKTTTAAKLAHWYSTQGKKVLFVAADTFRAAAVAQLSHWANELALPIIIGADGQDPASVVFAGCDEFIKKEYDIVIIDTAGRLHTKVHLMNELAKVKRIITKKLPLESVQTLLTIDSMLGQNSFEQAKLFQESTEVNGIILTKMDGTGKGGIVFAITAELHIPVQYITFGESVDAIKRFEAQEYVDDLLSKVE